METQIGPPGMRIIMKDEPTTSYGNRPATLLGLSGAEYKINVLTLFKGKKGQIERCK